MNRRDGLGLERPTGSRASAAALVKALVALLALTAVPAACSDDDDEASTTAPDTSVAADSPSNTVGPAADGPMAERSVAVVADHDSVDGASLFRPADLDAVPAPLPVVVTGIMANCTEVATPDLASRVEGYHRPIAAAGFLLVAVGTTDENAQGYFVPSDEPGPVWDRWQTALDAVVALNDDPDSPYHARIDVDRVGTWGISCGGWVAMNLAANDHRVSSLFNYTGCDFGSTFGNLTGPFGEALSAGEPPPGGILGQLPEQFPVAWFTGGPEDFTRECVRADFRERAPTTMPAFLAVHDSLGHEEMGANVDPLMLVNWFDFTLNGQADAREYFFGDPFGPCRDSDEPCPWTTRQKNWQSFSAG